MYIAILHIAHQKRFQKPILQHRRTGAHSGGTFVVLSCQKLISVWLVEYQVPFLCSSAGEPTLSEMGILKEGKIESWEKRELKLGSGLVAAALKGVGKHIPAQGLNPILGSFSILTSDLNPEPRKYSYWNRFPFWRIFVFIDNSYCFRCSKGFFLELLPYWAGGAGSLILSFSCKLAKQSERDKVQQCTCVLVSAPFLL